MSLIAPSLVLSRRHRELREENDGQQTPRLRDIVWIRMNISDRHGASQLVETLCSMRDHARQVLDLATAELRSALCLEAELELISEEFDVNDSTVPSIESHAQNEYREGVDYLVRVLAESLSQSATSDHGQTRRVVSGWKNFPGRIGLRLCLHAMRNAALFHADEAMSTLLSVSGMDFWEIRREIALLLKDRAGSASQALVIQVKERIRESSDVYFYRYTIDRTWRS